MTHTDDYDSFISAIVHDPFDDAPKLQFVDWLMENDRETACVNYRCCKGNIYIGTDGMKWIPCPVCRGHGTLPNNYALRAEFIQVQMAVANMDGTSSQHQRNLARQGWFANSPEGVALRLALWETPGVKLRLMDAGWTKGFVTWISCTESEWLRDGKLIVRNHPIVGVRLEDRHVVQYTHLKYFMWWDARAPGASQPPLNGNIDSTLFLFIRDGRPDVHASSNLLHNRLFFTMEDANAALSHACVNWARAEAGLHVLNFVTKEI